MKKQQQKVLQQFRRPQLQLLKQTYRINNKKLCLKIQKFRKFKAYKPLLILLFLKIIKMQSCTMENFISNLP